ncbi:MAG: hypothetical protein KatS3mg005_0010 [Bryobacteraceae bacterium]|nr:MAG: hypothetical protein KatS3mg005_0010 [Bryobacteraceae bacterium]
MAFSLLIGGAPYSWKQGTLNIVETLGGRSTCEFSIDNPDGSITAPQVGQSVLVKDGAYTIFAGSIETVEAVRYPGTYAGLWRVSCVDHHRILDRRITGLKSWQSTRAGDIVTEICTTYLGGEAVGLDFIQQGPIVERFEIDHATIAEALQKLAEVAGMVWYIDYGRQLRFFTPNSYACPFELEPDSTNFEDLVLRSTREQYANRIIAKIGQYVRDPQTARFDAQGRTGDGEEPLDWMKPDGSRKRWAVTFPVHAAPTVRVNGVSRTVGPYGDDAAEFYWQTGSREIGQSDSSAALGPGDVLEITYIGLSSEVLTVENAGEISRRASIEQHTGIYEKLIETSQEMTRADARQYAEAALDKLDSLSGVAVIDTNTIIEPLASTARVGQFIHVDVDGYRLEWKQVTAVEYGAPSVITVPGHGLMDGARIRLHQVTGLNGSWSVQVVDPDRLRLVGSNASGSYSGGGYAYPLTYLIRQIRTADVAGQLSVQLECVMGPATDDAVVFFRDLAAAQGIPPSAPRPSEGGSGGVPTGPLDPLEITSAAVEYRQNEGGWSYRLAVTLSGAAMSQEHYGGADVHVRFAAEALPSDWATVRRIGEHRPGDPATIQSPWWPITPGTSTQFWLRAVVRDRAGGNRAWGSIAGPFALHLPLGDAVPGAGHNWNFTAQLSGYWDDGNGVRLGKVDLSWSPLPLPGVLYGVYEHRSSSATPPSYSAYTPTTANTSDDSVTLWVRPPNSPGEFLHLALVAQLPADGVWPLPDDYSPGQLPVASVWLPVAGLSEQVSNWSVTVETDQSQDIPRGRFVFSFTPPADPDYHHVNVYRRPADSLGNPLADWLPDKVASMITGGPGGWWPLPSQPEHWLFKAVACNSLGQENPVSPPTVFMTVPTSAGVTMSKAKPSGVTGPMAVDGQGRITTAADRDVPLIASSQPGSAYLGSRIVQWMGQIWVWTGSQYQLDTNANRIKSELQQNGLTAAEFAATFAPVRVLSSVPSTYQGDFIVNTSDRRLYRWNGSAYVRPMPGSDIKLELQVDKLTAAEISAGAINTTHLAGNQINIGPFSGQPPRFVVTDSYGNQIGAIGEWSGFTGLWTVHGRFGGSFSNPIISLSNFGAQINNAAIYIATPQGQLEMSPSNALLLTSSGNKAQLFYSHLEVSVTGLASASYGNMKALFTNTSGARAEIGTEFYSSEARAAIGGSQFSPAIELYALGSSGSLRVGGVTVINSSRDGAFNSLSVGGSVVIDSNRYASVQQLSVQGQIRIDTFGRLRWPEVFNENIFLGGITSTKWVAAYDGAGYFVGKIPLI